MNYFLNPNDNIYYICYQSCWNCSAKYDSVSDNMNCISYIDGYYFILEEEKNNCYNMTLINQGFYLDISSTQNEPKFVKCMIIVKPVMIHTKKVI